MVKKYKGDGGINKKGKRKLRGKTKKKDKDIKSNRPEWRNVDGTWEKVKPNTVQKKGGKDEN